MAAMMTAAVLYGKEDLRLEQLAMPLPAEGEIVLQVGAALTCGTDLKVFRRGYHAAMPGAADSVWPRGGGGGIGGGSRGDALQGRDRVVALNSAPCDRCFWCAKGQQNLCEDLLFNNGAYAEFLRVPARIVEKNTLVLPREMKMEHAALTEPLACVVRGLDESGVVAGDAVVVIGAGPIGLMFVEAAHLAGARVIAVVKHSEQAMAARMFGASEVVRIDEADDVVEAVRALTPKGRGTDIAIDAVASPATWQQAVCMVRKGGVVNFFGGPPSGTVVELDTNWLHYGDITLKASFHHTPAACQRAFALIASGRLRASSYITARAGLGEVPELFRRMLSRSVPSEPEDVGDGALQIKTAVLPTEGVAGHASV